MDLSYCPSHGSAAVRQYGTSERHFPRPNHSQYRTNYTQSSVLIRFVVSVWSNKHLTDVGRTLIPAVFGQRGESTDGYVAVRGEGDDAELDLRGSGLMQRLRSSRGWT